MQAKWRKIVIGMIFIMMVAGSSITIAFADQNISGMLTEWFDRKTDESVEEIEEAILTEQEKQTEKLKEELRLAIEAAEAEMNEFVEAEKNSRVEEIRQYADSLMEDIEIDESELKAAKLKELEQILREAKTEMDQVVESGDQEKVNEEGLKAEEIDKETTKEMEEETERETNQETEEETAGETEQESEGKQHEEETDE